MMISKLQSNYGYQKIKEKANRILGPEDFKDNMIIIMYSHFMKESGTLSMECRHLIGM